MASLRPVSSVQMIDLHGEYLTLQPEIDEAIRRVLTDTAFINGPAVETFAQTLANYLGNGFVIPCGNGTDALQIALMGLGLKPGDEVIVPANTYVATAEAAALLQLTPVFTDIDPLSFNMDVQALEKNITSKTKAIIPVHLYGQCAAMESILQIAQAHHIPVIEDTAQALGASYFFKDGTRKKAGTIGLIGTTSFFPTKSLGCFGDGGAIFTNDAELAERMKMIANHGQRKKNYHETIGINSRLDTLQAAILTVKLKHLDKNNKKRNNIAYAYDQALSTIPGLEIPARDQTSNHVFHQYVIKTKPRNQLRDHLALHDIPSMIHYPLPLPLQKAYAKYNRRNTPVAEDLSTQILSLPIHPLLSTEQINVITSVIKAFFQ